MEEAKRLFAFAEHIYYLTEPDKRWWNIKARDVKVRASLRDFREQMEVSLEEWKGGSSIIRSETETAEEEKTKQEQKNTQATTAKVESEAKTIEVEAERGRSKSGGTLHERSRGRRFTISSTDDDDEVTARYEDSDDKSSYLSAPSLPPPSPPSSPPRTTTTAPLFPPPTKSAPHPPASEAKEWRRRHALSEHLREEERKRRLRLEGGIEGGAEVALKYLEVASEAGYGPATYLLAAAVRRGYGDRSRNPRKAKMLLELAAEQEDGDALFEMAMIEAGDEAELRDGPFYRSPETEEKSGVGPREDSFSAALRHLESVGEERERAAERDERRWHSRGVGTEGMGEHAEKGQWDLDFLLPPSKYGYLEHSSEGVRDDVPLGRYRESKLEANRSAANLDRAAHLFWRAVQSSGHVESAFRLGCLLEKGAIHVPLSDGRRRRFSGEEEEAERIRDAIALYRYVRRCAEESGGYHEGATNNLACLLYRCPSSLLSPSLQGSKAEAIALFRELEDRGGGIAANHLGIAIEEREWSPGVQEENRSTDGGVVVVDEEEKPKRQERKEKEAALRYYKLSHERGHVAGSLNAGRVLVELERHSEAEQYLQRAAAADEGQAYYLLAKIAEKEAGEREERKKWRDKERERIDHMARTLAKAPEDEESERTGAAVESKGGSVASLSTPDLWRRWQYYLERALERGVREAALEAGLVQYERAVRGDRGPGAFERVAELFAAGARFGSAEAMNQLGILYEEGRGVPLSLTRAAQLYAAAADLDHPMGLFNRGMALWEGRGADHNPLQARLLFKRVSLSVEFVRRSTCQLTCRRRFLFFFLLSFFLFFLFPFFFLFSFSFFHSFFHAFLNFFRFLLRCPFELLPCL